MKYNKPGTSWHIRCSENVTHVAKNWQGKKCCFKWRKGNVKIALVATWTASFYIHMNVACLLHVSQSICKQNTIEVGTGQNRNLHYLLKCHIKSSACSQLVRIYCVLASGIYSYIFPSWVRTLAYIKHLLISTRFLTCAHIFSHISLWWRNMYSLLSNIYLNIPYTASIAKISMNRKTKICSLYTA